MLRVASVVAVLLLGTVMVLAAGAPKVSAPKSGAPKSTNDGPKGLMVNKTVMVPIRPVANWLGATMTAGKGSVTVAKGKISAKLTMKSTEALVNGAKVKLAEPAMEAKGMTFAPLRFLADTFKVQVAWEEKKGLATLTRDGAKPLKIEVMQIVPMLMIPKEVVEMFKAAVEGNTATVTKLAKAHPELVNERDADGMTPLLLAAARGKAEVVDALLEAKADPNQPNRLGQTPLHIAALGGSEACVKRLLAAGAKIGAHDFKNDLPIHFAAITDNVAIAKLLLVDKVGLNDKDKDGDTPLHCAEKAKKSAMAAYLRSIGAHD